MKKIIGFVFVFLAMGVLLHQMDFPKLWYTVRLVPISIFLILILLQMATLFLLTYQWYSISGKLGAPMTFRSILHICLHSTFVESVTPSVKAGGEATKVYMFSARGIQIGKAAAIVLFQKIISMLSFLILNTIAVIWFLVAVSQNEGLRRVLFSGLGFLLIIFLLLLLMTAYPASIGCFTGRIPVLQRLGKKLVDLWFDMKETLALAKNDPVFLLSHLVFSLVIWLLYAVKAYILVLAFRIQLGFLPTAVVTYLSYMVGMLPLLPGGSGSFEAAMVFLLIPLYVDPTTGIALAIVLRLITFWLVFLVSGFYVLWCSLRSFLRRERLAA